VDGILHCGWIPCVIWAGRFIFFQRAELVPGSLWRSRDQIQIIGGLVAWHGQDPFNFHLQTCAHVNCLLSE
jgi:hypothetical protein